MTTFDTLTRTEKVLLLGFLPLLGATAQLGMALTAAVICVVAASAVRVAARIAGRIASTRIGPTAHWAIYAAVGFVTAHAVTAAMTFVVPVPADVVTYLHLTGLTPLVFIGVPRAGSEPGKFAPFLLRACILILSFGMVREFLGSGTLLGMRLWADGLVPFGILGSSAGALILYAGTGLCDSLLLARRSQAEEVNV